MIIILNALYTEDVFFLQSPSISLQIADGSVIQRILYSIFINRIILYCISLYSLLSDISNKVRLRVF